MCTKDVMARRKFSFLSLILTLSTVKVYGTVPNCLQFPVGTGGSLGPVVYNAVAVSATYIAAGGQCSDNNLCPSSPRPIIDIFQATQLNNVWSLYVPYSSATNTNVASIAIEPTNSYVVVVLGNTNAQAYVLLVIQGGSVIYALTSNLIRNCQTMANSLYVDSSLSITTSCQLTTTYQLFQVRPSSTPITQWAYSAAGGNIVAFVPDPINGGLYLTGYFPSQGSELSILYMLGAVQKWSVKSQLVSSTAIATSLDLAYYSPNYYLWSCGSTGLGATLQAFFTVFQVNGSALPSPTHYNYIQQTSTTNCYAISGQTGTLAYAIVSVQNQFQLGITQINLGTTNAASSTSLYIGVYDFYGSVGTLMTSGAFFGSNLYIAGSLINYANIGYTLTYQAGYVMSLPVGPGISVTSCLGYNIIFPTTSDGSNWLSIEQTVTTAQTFPITLTSISIFTTTGIVTQQVNTQGIINLNCAQSNTPVVFPNYIYDIGLQSGTKMIPISNMLSTVCTYPAASFSASFSPSSGNIALQTGSNINWSLSTITGVFQITAIGTISNSLKFTTPFTVTLIDSCHASTLPIPQALTITYTLSAASQTLTIGPFVPSVSGCLMSYTIQYLNGTSLAPPFSLSGTTLTVGPTSNTAFNGITSIVAKAQLVNEVTSATQSITVTIQDGCYLATIAVGSPQVISYTVLQATQTSSLSGAFTTYSPTGFSNCFGPFKLYTADQATMALLPNYITFNYPTLTIGPTVANQILSQQSVVLNYQINAQTMVTGVSVFQSLQITIVNECTNAIVPNLPAQSISYTLTASPQSFTVAPFVPSLSQCQMTYQLSFNANGTVISSNPLISYSSNTITLGPSYDATLIGQYVLKLTATLTLGTASGYQLITASFLDGCNFATLAAASPQVFSYTVLGPTQSNSLNTAFTESAPFGFTNCFTYKLYSSDQITLVTLPTYITFNYPTLTIGPTVANQISVQSLVTTYYIQATVAASGISVFQSLQATILNECTAATITNPPSMSVTYSLTSTQPITIGPFIPTPSNCQMTYQVSFIANNSDISSGSLYALYSNILTIGPSNDNTLIGSYDLKVTAKLTLGTSSGYQIITVNVQDGCNILTLVAAAPQVFTYTVLAPTQGYSMSTAFTSTGPIGLSNCITYQLYNIDQTTIATPPPYLSFNFPTLTIGPTVPNQISTQQQITSYFIKAIIMVSGATVFQSLQTTIINECTSSTIQNPSTASMTYSITDVSKTLSIGPFLPSISTCQMIYSLAFSNGTAITSNPLFSLSSTTISVGVSNDPSLISTYTLIVTAQLTLGTSTATQTITVNVQSGCYLATLSSLTPQAFTYQILDPIKTDSLSRAYTVTAPLGFTNCFTFSLYMQDQVTMAIPPTYLVFNYPTIIIGPTVANQISLQQQLIMNYQIKASITVTGVSVFQNLSITINNECTTASISSNSLSSFSYTILGGTQTQMLTSFTLIQPATASCFSFSLSGSVPNYISLSYPTLTIGATVAGDLNTASQVFNLNVNGVGKLAGSIQQTASLTITVYHQCYALSLTPPNNIVIPYILRSPTQIITINPFTLSTCEIQYTVNYVVGDIIGAVLLPIDSSFSFNSSAMQLTIYAQSNPSYVGNHVLQISASVFMSQPLNIATMLVTVQATCSIIALSPDSKDIDVSAPGQMKQAKYTLGQGSLSIAFGQFVPLVQCNLPINYAFSLSSGGQLPEFITTQVNTLFGGGSVTILLSSWKLDQNTLLWTVRVTGSSDTQAPTLGVTIDVTLDIPILLIVPNTGPPYFKTSLKNVVTSVGVPYPLRLPDMADPDTYDSPIFVSIDWGTAKSYVTGAFPSYLINPKSNKTDYGVSTVTVYLKDNNPNPLLSNYAFQLTVKPLPPPLLPPPSVSSVIAAVANLSNTVPSNTITPTSSTSSKIVVLKKLNMTKPILPLTATITKISNQAVVSVSFNMPVIPPANLSDIDSLVLNLVVKPGSGAIKNQLLISTWNCTSKLKLLISFYRLRLNGFQIIGSVSNPIKNISKFQSPDILALTIIENKYFLDSANSNPIAANTKLQRNIPKQLKNDAATAMFSSASGPTSSMMISVMYGNLIFNIVMSASMQLLWGMINVLQLIVNFPLLNIQFPSNASVFFGLLNNIATFALLPTGTFNPIIFNFTSQAQPPNNFQNMGFSDCNLINNLGSMFYYIIGTVPLVLFTLLLKRFKDYSKVAQIMYDYLYKAIFYNLIITMFLQSYISCFISILLNLQGLAWVTLSDQLTSGFTFLIAVVIFSMPFLFLGFLMINFKQLGSESVQARFGSLYSDLRIESKTALLFNVIYMSRRIVIALSALYLQDYPAIQIQIIILHCICLLMYNILVQPFDDPFLNRLEMFNEVSILMIASHLLLFTNATGDPDFQYSAGWSIIGFTIINLITNSGVMFWVTAKQLPSYCRRLKQRYEKYKASKKTIKIKLDPQEFEQRAQTTMAVSGLIRNRDGYLRTAGIQNIQDYNSFENSAQDVSATQEATIQTQYVTNIVGGRHFLRAVQPQQLAQPTASNLQIQQSNVFRRKRDHLSISPLNEGNS